MGAKIDLDRLIDFLQEKGIIEFELTPNETEQAPTKSKQKPASARQTWESYREAYIARYQVEPVRNAKVNAHVANFVKRVGENDAPEVIKFFVNHNDSFYVRQTHSISLALKDAESLRTQWLKRRPITAADVREMENRDHYRSQIERIERGEL